MRSEHSKPLVAPLPSSPPGNGTRHHEGPPLDSRLFELLVQSVRDYAIFMLDPAGHVQTWNTGAEHIKGYTAEQIVGKHFSIFYPPEDVGAGKPEMELRVAAAVGRFEDEGWRLRQDGTRLWANVVITALRDEAGRLVGFGKVTRDLTERRRTEEVLRESEERLRLLILNVRDYAIYMLDPAGFVRSWNPGAEAIKGYRAEEIIGKHFSLFYPPEDAAEGRPARELAIARAEGRYAEEGLRVRKDGSRFWASVVLTAVRNEAGELMGFAKVTRDLTNLRLAEDERLRLAHAQEAVRLRDEFLVVASQELSTPLATLQLQLERLAEPGDLPGHAASQIERALRSTGRLVALVDTVLDVARVTAGRLKLTREHFDLGAAIRETVYRLGGDARKTGATITMREKGRVEGSWDRLRLEQVFTNLITNAITYGAGTPIAVAIESDGQAARIIVTDHGPGIAPADRDRIFVRFERAVASPLSGGLGLGLYITRQIVNAHGGSIELESTPGGGATFTVRLPVAPPGGAAPAAA